MGVRGQAADPSAGYGRRGLLVLLKQNPGPEKVVAWFRTYDDCKKRELLEHSPDLIGRVRQIVGRQDWMPSLCPGSDLAARSGQAEALS